MVVIFRMNMYYATVNAKLSEIETDLALTTPDDYTIRFVVSPPMYKAFKKNYTKCITAEGDPKTPKMPCIEFFEKTIKALI